MDAIATKFLALRDAGKRVRSPIRLLADCHAVQVLLLGAFTLLGSPNDTDVGPVCNDAGGNALAWTFGLGISPTATVKMALPGKKT
jgi:hypothetical protein